MRVCVCVAIWALKILMFMSECPCLLHMDTQKPFSLVSLAVDVKGHIATGPVNMCVCVSGGGEG